MTNMKIEMNHILMTHKNSKQMEYFDQTVKLIVRVIRGLINNTKKGARLAQRYFLHKRLNFFGREGCDALTKEMDQIYRQTGFELISIKEFKKQYKTRAQEAMVILEQKITTKNPKDRITFNGKATR